MCWCCCVLVLLCVVVWLRGCVWFVSTLGPPGLHTTTRELQTCTYQFPSLQKHHQNSTRRLPRERRKNEISCGREKKKSAKFWAPPPFGPPSGSHHPTRPRPNPPTAQPAQTAHQRKNWPNTVWPNLVKPNWPNSAK